ncbi:hypothetical protein F4818DRAFT_428908 [Hypoxylon cercidicola]|nr:hypothetical protein F4818DRAFT_428908 [Hypoxylon cercidicola]
MVYGWQLRLSPRPPSRTETPIEPRLLSPCDAALFEFISGDDGRMIVRETHYADNKFVQDGLSGPKIHIHLGQNEYFEVHQGTLSVIRNGIEYALTKDDGVFEIPAGTRHRFWAHPSIRDKREDLKFQVWAKPNEVDRGFNENCLRNYFGYLKDCLEHNMTPSVFQMALFGWSWDTIMLVPPFWMPLWSLRVIQHVAGHWIGKRLLGYQASYPEYDTKPRADSEGVARKYS